MTFSCPNQSYSLSRRGLFFATSAAVSRAQGLLRCADLFAILKTTEKLERAYVRDAVTAKDYELQCSKLIAQFKTLWDTLKEQVAPGAG